jgi:protein required for attachment to host cells
MENLHIAHDAWVLIGDGRKALFMRNAGTPQKPDLEVIDVLEDKDNPPTREQGTERPGRTMESTTARKSAMEQTDWHTRAEEKFAETVAAKLDAQARVGKFDRLIVVAPPPTLATLRKSFHANTQELIVAEVPKDFTNHPAPEIARLLTGG